MFGITPYRAYNPFRELEKIERSLFGDFPRGAAFKTDIIDSGDSYRLEAELPGFKKEDIHIDISGGILTVSAERREEKKETDGAGNLIHSERVYGTFERSFDLTDIEDGGITASYTDGILKLDMPKKAKTAPSSRRLEIL